MKENKKFINVFTRNIFELAALKLVMSCKRNFSNTAADTVALSETAVFEVTHSPMQDVVSVKLKRFWVELSDIIVYFELVYC